MPTTVHITDQGNQTISGVKTFATGVVVSGNLQVSGTGIFNAIDLNSIDNLSLSGVDITITSGVVALTNRPTVNGTGVLLSGEAAQVDLSTTVRTTGNQIVSGIKSFATGVNISGQVGIGINNNDKFGLYVRKSSAGAVNPDDGSIAVFEGSGNSHITVLASNAQTAGVVLGSPADNFGSYLSWNHDNNLLKLATSKPTGFIQILTDDERVAVTITSGGNVGIGTISPSEKLQVAGNIKASGASFATGIDVINSGNPQNLRVFNKTGTNTGEFGIFGWNNNQLTIGAQQTNSGILRDIILTGANININASGVLNIFDPVNITGNVTITGHLSASSKSFLIDHPTQLGKKLQYGSLEGPEHGVFVRGKTNENIINLPNYWASLVDENSISVNLTPIDVFSNIYIVEYNNRRVVTDGNNGNYYFYTVYGERKDIPKLTVEF